MGQTTRVPLFALVHVILLLTLASFILLIVFVDPLIRINIRGASKMSTSSIVIPESLIPYLDGQLTDYSSIQGTVIRCNIVFITIVVISSGLRIFVRFRLL